MLETDPRPGSGAASVRIERRSPYVDATRAMPARLAVFDPAGWIANLELLLGRLGRAGAIAVDLRANAYGHGLDRCAGLLAALAAERGQELLPVVSEGERTGSAPGAGSAPVIGSAPIIGPESFGLVEGAGTRPVLRLEAEIMLVKEVAAGEAISYGRSYPVEAPTRTGLVAIGYSDGAVRRASSACEALAGGRRCRIAGAISMDQLVLDLGDAPAESGDRAVLYGDGADGGPTAREWAARTGIPAPAITARIAPTVERGECSSTRFDAASAGVPGAGAETEEGAR